MTRLRTGTNILSDRPMLLAVETSGTVGSIAICEGETLLIERMLDTAGHRHAQTIVSEVDSLLRELKLQPRDIQTVAVSIGPGSFTGLRVGLVFAKTYAWLNQTELVAVDTLRAIAQQAPKNIEQVTAAIDAQRGELFVGTYQWDEITGCRQLIRPIHVSSQDGLPIGQTLTGPGLAKLRPELHSQFHLLDETLWQPRASSVAKLGLNMRQQREISVPETLEPVYVRVSYAEEKRDSQT